MAMPIPRDRILFSGLNDAELVAAGVVRIAERMAPVKMQISEE